MLSNDENLDINTRDGCKSQNQLLNLAAIENKVITR